MRIGRFLISGRPVVMVDLGEGFIDYGALLEMRGISSMVAGADPEKRVVRMLRHGLLDEDFVKEHVTWAKHQAVDLKADVAERTPLLPLRPAKIICMARNFKAHADEQGVKVPSQPIFFLKGDNAATGPGMPIIIPQDMDSVDYEGELGVVVGKRAHAVKAENAPRYIAGYTIVNDITGRLYQKELAREGRPWYPAKGLDTFAPIGPFIVSPQQVGDISQKRIQVRVNGELRQDALLGEMIWGVPQLIEAISKVITLEPGDVIATGTPAGVGPLFPGDTVSIMIEGVGELTNRVEKQG
ncbi:MAG: fumarylacetoacetate hydrolase family protein [bacterium]